MSLTRTQSTAICDCTVYKSQVFIQYAFVARKTAQTDINPQLGAQPPCQSAAKHSEISLIASERSCWFSAQMSIGTDSFSCLVLETVIQQPVLLVISLILFPLYPMSLPMSATCRQAEVILPHVQQVKQLSGELESVMQNSNQDVVNSRLQSQRSSCDSAQPAHP